MIIATAYSPTLYMTTNYPIRFQITAKQPGAHLFEVVCTVDAPDSAGQVFSLPAWIPGSYMIRDFAKDIVQLWVSSGGRPVAVHKLDKGTWQCAPCSQALTVRYEVYAWDLSVRAAHLDTTHGFFNGTSVFVKMHGKQHLPHEVEIRPPVGEVYGEWRVATGMARLDAPPHGFGRYGAADYDELIDHPVEMGTFTLAGFEAGGIPHGVAITGRHRADVERLCRDLKAVCEEQIRLFGEPPPMAHYLFLVTAVGSGYGGLEHRASCALLCSRDDLPQRHQAALSEKYRGFLALCSHEYFHAWNIKRIKPAAFTPYDLSKENYTGLLWAFEGVTSYYQYVMLLRCGLITNADFLELMGRTATRVWRGAGRFKQSVAESSFDAWTKFYKQDENAANAIVNYYSKGALLALALDLLIRRDTRNTRSLDDVMRGLWNAYGETGIGVEEDGVERMVTEVCGVDLRGFFDAVLRGVEDPPLAELLPQFGVDFELRPAESSDDKGGRRPKESPDRLQQRPVLGVRLAEQGMEAKLAQVLDGGAAQRAGLAAGDIVMAVDNLRAKRTNLDALLAVSAPGDTVVVHAFRRDELMTFSVVLQAAPVDTCVLTLREDVDDTARALRAAWLGAA
ncbi:MAG: PDZ domain-containing protein [Gammaproteobacteria bacterium]